MPTSLFHGQDNLLKLIERWQYWYLDAACPQSHLKRCLHLDGGHLRRLLDLLVEAGLVCYAASPYAGEPDVRRVWP